MKKNNSDIINKVKNVISENKGNKIKKDNLTTPSNNSQSDQQRIYSDGIDKILNEWIETNAEKIAKELIKEEVKKIFK